MTIACCACNCGSSDLLARKFLETAGYPDWFSMPVPKGKEKSLKLLSSLPRYKEISDIEQYLSKVTRWVIIIGWNDNGCRWTDITHGGEKSNIEGKLIIKTFA